MLNLTVSFGHHLQKKIMQLGTGIFGKMNHFWNYIAYIILNMTYGLRLGNGLNQ